MISEEPLDWNRCPKSPSPLLSSPEVPGDSERDPSKVRDGNDEDDLDLDRDVSKSLILITNPPFTGKCRSLVSGTEVMPSSVSESMLESSSEAAADVCSDVSTQVV